MEGCSIRISAADREAASIAAALCGYRSLEVLRGASRSNSGAGGPDEAFRAVDDLLPPASISRLEGPWVVFVIPGEGMVKILGEALVTSFADMVDEAGRLS